MIKGGDRMKICKNCLIPMVGVKSFSKYKREKFYKCPKCYAETKHKKLKNKELDFREVLYKKLNNL